MQQVRTNINKWEKKDGAIVTAEGYKLSEKQLGDQCDFLRVPKTLLNIDREYNLDTTLQVLRAASVGEERLLVDDNGEVLSVLDHRSTFMEDEQFFETLKLVEDNSIKAPCEIRKSGAAIRATYTLEETGTDTVLGDVFNRQVIIERKPEGGIYIGTGLLRLVCTNGCQVADKEYRQLFRNNVNPETFAHLMASIRTMDVTGYFSRLFSNNGKWIEASVADYMGMRKTLSDIVGNEVAAEYFPVGPIYDHYEAQNIEVNKMSRTIQQKLPAGVTYFDAFNIMTNGCKRAADTITLADEIEVANWARPSKLKQLRESDIQHHGMPSFPKQLIKRLKGDAA